jgi:MSHA biogenesis protein MshM
MYLDHFGLDSAPFNITSQTDFFFDGAARGSTLDALLYAVQQGEGIVKVTGEVGSGKTMLCRMLVESLPDNVETIFLSIPSLKRDEMLQALCMELGLKIDGLAPYPLLAALQKKLIDLYGQNCHVVALIDEAHAMPLESLEEIRLLSNLENGDHKLLQIVLFGQPELDDHLRLPHMRQLKERITHSFHLRPLTKSDVAPYLNHRLDSAGYRGPALFSQSCVNLIATASEGLTRRINIIADKSLLAAYAENTRAITPAHVRAAIRDCDLPSPPQWGKRAAITAATLAVAVGIGLALKNAHFLETPAASVTAKTAQQTAASSNAIAESKPDTGTREAKPELAAAKPGEAHTSEKTESVTPPTSESKAESAPAAKAAQAENKPEQALAASKAVVSKEENETKVSPSAVAAATSTITSQADEVSKNPASTSKLPATAANSAQLAAPQVAKLEVITKPSDIPPAKPEIADNNKITNNQQDGQVDPVNTPANKAVQPSQDLDNRVNLSKTWLASQAENQCVIQLLMADISNAGNVEFFIGQADRQLGAGKIYVLPSHINGHDKYTVIYGNFSKGMNCQAALGKLPAAYRQAKPYTRSVGLLRNEVKFPG